MVDRCLKLGEGIVVVVMGIGFHPFQRFFVTSAQHSTGGGTEAVALLAVVLQRTQFAEVVAAGALQLVGERVNIVLPHLAGNVLAHTLTLGQHLDHAVVTIEVGAEGEGATRGVVGARRRVVIGGLHLTTESTYLRQFH